MKKKLIAVLAVIALFIPTFLAIGSYFLSEQSPAETGKVTEMKILDINGKEFTVSAADDKNGVIKSFLDMNEGATKLDSLPEPLLTADYFMVTYSSKSTKDADYKYYFSLDENEAYFVDNGGVAYKIKEADAKKFLATEYSSCLYTTAKAPVLTVASTAILPETIAWKYKSAGGEYIDLGDIKTAEQAVSVAVEGAIDFTFDVAPDSLFVTITKGNEVIFNDTYEKLSTVDLDQTANLAVKLEAKWYEDDGRDYYGEATYSFGASISESAAFYLVQNEIAPGDFVVLTGKNVTDISKISFSSTPSIDFTPVFFSDGDYVRALIPIKVELENKSYVFTVKYGDTFSQELGLTIREQNFNSRTWTNSKSNLESTRSEAALSAYKSTMASVAASRLGEKLWVDGDFASVGKDSQAVAGFGQYITLKETGETFRHDGAYYYMAAGASITAINRGKVIYVGVTDYSGITVVVDHGFGLKSWYSNMSEAKVAVGDIVERGGELGIIGGSGFIKDGASRAVHVKLTVFDVPVFPYDSKTYGALNIKMYND